ncbi:hypothetical protein K458DRAFT_431338 [Lentithecium fluviatile CBS 122367]|uniref:Uncharacterized protein n=1 Tax=Lentithecium fluviatile CBS 122367 TaxID=1168545 RepID=A0A6G1J2D4_9PLEO|nr:hypothetical protein K458DRAFT_431338 [Lentithecium fluviatile CBS 122367]
MEESVVSASISVGAKALLETTPSSSGNSKEIPHSLFNLTRFQNLSLSDQWSLHVDTDSMRGQPDATSRPQANQTDPDTRLIGSWDRTWYTRIPRIGCMALPFNSHSKGDNWHGAMENGTSFQFNLKVLQRPIKGVVMVRPRTSRSEHRQCEPIDEINNQSSWLVDLPAQDTTYDDEGPVTFPDGYELARIMFTNATTSTTVVGDTNVVVCCANGTISDPKRSLIGYWSPTGPKPNSRGFPYAERKWPVPFVTKWIVGDPRSISYSGESILCFEKPPSLQAARCSPVIDVTEATVSVDIETGTIHSPEDSTPGGGFEYLSDNAFNIRDQDLGLNMDLMTYSMYALADRDLEALLNYTTLLAHANRTFQTFFQQFVNNKLSVTDGGWAYQKLDDRILEGLGRPIDENGNAIAERRTKLLYLNPVATYLSAAIVIWFIATAAAITCLQRRYTSAMLRDVELIADVLVPVAGSDSFLRLVQERGLDLKKYKEVRTKLGWFKDRDREVRWGVEVVGGPDAVEWVDPPKKKFV